MLKSSNPAWNNIQSVGSVSYSSSESVMTIGSTINKTLLMMAILIASASVPWSIFYSTFNYGLPNSSSSLYPWMIGGAIGGLIFAMITIFKHQSAFWSAPLYAVCEGFFIGAFSAILSAIYPGIVIQAVGLTFGTMIAVLLAYKSGFVQATERFRFGVVAATGGIALSYLASFILSFFGISTGILGFNSGLFSILFSLFVVIVAALNLVLDFDLIERLSEERAPKYMEWYASFGLLVTLIWLYIEFVRLLVKLKGGGDE